MGSVNYLQLTEMNIDSILDAVDYYVDVHSHLPDEIEFSSNLSLPDEFSEKYISLAERVKERFAANSDVFESDEAIFIYEALVDYIDFLNSFKTDYKKGTAKRKRLISEIDRAKRTLALMSPFFKSEIIDED